MKLHNYYSFINENKQLAEKVYIKTGELSQEDFEKILDITHFNKLNENWSNQTNINELVNHIETLPIRFRLTTRRGDTFQVYPDGLQTALNNSCITKMYLKFHNYRKRSIQIPELDPTPYNKLNTLIQQYQTAPNSRLFGAMCFQLMDILLFEDFFGVEFVRGNAHQIVMDLDLSQDYETLFNLFDNRDSIIRNLIFFSTSVPLVRSIEDFCG